MAKTSPLDMVTDALGWDAGGQLSRLLIVAHAAFLDAGFIMPRQVVRPATHEDTVALSFRYTAPQLLPKLTAWEAGVVLRIHYVTIERRALPFEYLLMMGDSRSANVPDSGLQELIVTATWYLWWERRQAVRNEPIQRSVSTAQAIAAIATNYYKAVKPNIKMRRHGWEKPKEGYVKLNVDAGFDDDSQSGSTGAIIRDGNGKFIAACNYGIAHVMDATTAEAHALRDGLILAGQIGCNRIVVNSDCMEVILTMQDNGNSIGAAAAIYEECSFLARNFDHVIFEHSPRESNRVAHTLACNAVRHQSIRWIDDPPDFIFALVLDDVNLFHDQ